MLRYRAATLLIRTHIPEVLNGMHTVEELKDVELNNKPIKLKEVSSEEKAENTINSYLDEKDSEEIKTIAAESNFADKVNNLEILINQSNLSEDIVNSWLKKAQAETLADLSEEQIQSCIDFMHKNAHVKTSVAG
jgi:hypothetical protein